MQTNARRQVALVYSDYGGITVADEYLVERYLERNVAEESGFDNSSVVVLEASGDLGSWADAMR